MYKKIFFIIFILFCTSASTQVPPKSTPVKDTLLLSTDSTVMHAATDTISAQDSLTTIPTAALKIDTTKSTGLKVSKRNYNHREQIIFASIMMIFVAIVISSAQNWNPD